MVGEAKVGVGEEGEAARRREAATANEALMALMAPLEDVVSEAASRRDTQNNAGPLDQWWRSSPTYPAPQYSSPANYAPKKANRSGGSLVYCTEPLKKAITPIVVVRVKWWVGA